MTWFLGFAILAILFGFEWYAYFFARVSDPSRAAWNRPYWEYATLSWLSPSINPTVERHRRASVAYLGVAVVWLFLGLPVGGTLDALAREAGGATPWLTWVTVLVSVIVLVLVARAVARIASRDIPTC